MQISTFIPRHNVALMAELYNNAPDEFHKIDAATLWGFKKLINVQFSDISKVIDIEFVEYEPYGETPLLEDILSDFRAGCMQIHTTGNDSKVWGTFHNLQFRAIHDYIHCLHELQFTHHDECSAFSRQVEFSLNYADKFPYLNWDIYTKVLRSEIVYQSSLKETDNVFHIDQKIVLGDALIQASQFLD